MIVIGNMKYEADFADERFIDYISKSSSQKHEPESVGTQLFPL